MVDNSQERLLEPAAAAEDSDLFPSTTALERAQVRRRGLHQAMEYLEFVAASPTSTDHWSDSVETALLRLRAALESHIGETEGPDGILAEIFDTTPRLGAEVAGVRSEHPILLAALDRALSTLEEERPVDATGVRRRVVALLGRLTLHRQRGADLVYEAFNVDIGVGD